MADLEARVAALESEVAALKARDAIYKTLSQYAIAVDDKRPELLSNIFFEDAGLSIPAWDVEAKGIEGIEQFLQDYWSRFDHPRRYYANQDIDVDGSSATAFMYWHVTQVRDGQSVLAWGTYDWIFEQAGDSWLIKHVTVSILAMTTLEHGWAGSDIMQL